jgi:hypothetical protein
MSCQECFAKFSKIIIDVVNMMVLIIDIITADVIYSEAKNAIIKIFNENSVARNLFLAVGIFSFLSLSLSYFYFFQKQMNLLNLFNLCNSH